MSDHLDHIRQDPELLEDSVDLVVVTLSSEQKAGLARRKLRTGWLYCVCPPDERAMIHRRMGFSRAESEECVKAFPGFCEIVKVLELEDLKQW